MGFAASLRGYIHGKSGDWPGNDPRPLAGWEPQELAALPTYCVMHRGAGMCRTVSPHLDHYRSGPPCSWSSGAELQVYADAFARTGLQGALNWYRSLTGGIGAERLAGHVGAPITVPAAFIAGAREWGIHQASTVGSTLALSPSVPALTATIPAGSASSDTIGEPHEPQNRRHA